MKRSQPFLKPQGLQLQHSSCASSGPQHFPTACTSVPIEVDLRSDHLFRPALPPVPHVFLVHQFPSGTELTIQIP
jgi:hypothetical protein